MIDFWMDVLGFEHAIVHLTSLESITLQEVQHVLQTQEMRLENLNSFTMIELFLSISNFAQKISSQTPVSRGS